MPRPPEKGIPAKYKYQNVKYSHFEVGPGDSLVLTADPWSYLSAWLTQHAPSRGEGRKNYERAGYYADLAESFVHAAEVTPFPAKGTLAYYGLLNLVKCFLSVRGVPLEDKVEHHGLTVPLGQTGKVQVRSPSSDSINVFHEFSAQLGTPITGSDIVEVKELCAELLEIHEMAYTLGHLPGGKRKFLPVEIHFLVNESKQRLFTELRYEKKNEARVPHADKFYTGARKAYFKELGENDGYLVFRSNRRRAVSTKNWDRVYRLFCAEHRAFALKSLLTRDGYRHYCDLRPGKYPQLCNVLMLLFYVGSIARYRPSETRTVLRGELRPLIAEAIVTCPHQFLYQLVSLTTGSICAVPHAKLA